MKKTSPKMNLQKKFEIINSKLFPKLKNTGLNKLLLIITFSGIPGSGKTTLSKNLEDTYEGVSIRNDLIRDIINKNDLVNSLDESEKLLQRYNLYLISNWPFKNKLIILDKSMDRQYKLFFPEFKRLNLRYFVIRINISPEKAIERILSRSEKEDPVQVKESMKRWKQEFDTFGKEFKYDLELEGKIWIIISSIRK